MKFYNYDIVFQEIPDEVTLAINITNCPNRCQACHSQHLWKDEGTELTTEVVDQLIAKYKNQITCLCLMGGDADTHTVSQIAQYIRAHSSLKVGWYSGRTKFPTNPDLFDFVKLGPYIPDKGGLKQQSTNQRLYKRNNGTWRDITARFHKLG